MANTRASLTGDPVTDALIAPASRLIWAVHQHEPAEVAAAFADAAQVGGDNWLQGLVVVMAGMVDPSSSPGDLLAWTNNPEQYKDLLNAGFASATAVTVIRAGVAA
jgi:hypothetical protein